MISDWLLKLLLFQIIMHLLEEGVPTNHSINIGMNGNDDHSDYDTSETDSDIEEPQPVSATLVLRVVTEPVSPPVYRKNSSRKDENHKDTFLQVNICITSKHFSRVYSGPSTKIPVPNIRATQCHPSTFPA